VLENKENEIVDGKLRSGVFVLDVYDDGADGLGDGENTGDEDLLGRGTGSENVPVPDE
jgi:hypothetical protein